MFNNVLSEAIKDGLGIKVILLLIALRIIYVWVLKADPLVLIRGVINFRTHRLENMLNRPCLTDNDKNCILQELRQINHLSLTGFRSSRLQDLAVEFSLKFGLPGRYLKPWRRYLSEDNGRILFDYSRYRRNLNLYYKVNFPLSTGILIFILLLANLRLGEEKFFLTMILNLYCWYIPWIILTTPAKLDISDQMHNYVLSFNMTRDDGNRHSDSTVTLR